MSSMDGKGFVIHVKSENDDHSEIDLSLADQAKQAAEAEHSITVFQALFIYRAAIFWTVAYSLAIIMDGYDMSLPGSFYAQPAFNRKFGVLLHNGDYSVEAKWQIAVGMSGHVGRIIGGLTAGSLSQRFGRKIVLIVTLILCIGVIFVQFFASNISTLCVGFYLSSCVWGVFNTLATAYASEVCPVILRGIFATYINLSWVMGQFIAQGVLNATSRLDSQWAYRIPFTIQWLWPVILIIIIPLAPESPWWLVRKGRYSDAEKSLKRLTNLRDEKVLDQMLALMINTDLKDLQRLSGSSYMDCFRGINLRRTEISCMAISVLLLSGSSMIGYGPYFFVQAGLNANNAFKLSLGMTAIGFCGTISSWFLLSYMGRRRVYIAGLTAISFFMFLIGILEVSRNTTNDYGIKWAQSILLLFYVLAYDLTIGPTCYAILGETPSSRLREKTIAIGMVAYSIWGIIFQVAQPYMLNVQNGNWRGKVGFLYGGLGLICITWCYFRLPELGYRTYAEIDFLFAQNIKATEFKRYKVDLMETESSEILEVKDENLTSI